MSMLIERLRATGADMDGAMKRMLGDQELYETCFSYFLKDPAFATLGEALSGHDYPAAFDAAHTLKGVAGNLGLTSIYTDVDEIVEPLREGQPGNTDLFAIYRALLADRDILEKMAE